jgi:hypothetical protein
LSITTPLKAFSILRQLRPHEKWTREQLEIYQAGVLRNLREYVYERSPFIGGFITDGWIARCMSFRCSPKRR